MIKREFAPADQRLRQLVAREKAMPAALAGGARRISSRPAADLTRKSPSNRSMATASSSRRPYAAAFTDVKDTALLGEVSRRQTMPSSRALADYKKWLQDDLLKRSNGEFAIRRAIRTRKKLAADEMIEHAARRSCWRSPSAICEKNQAAFAETAQAIDPQALAAWRCSRRCRPSIRRPRSSSRSRRPSSMRSAAS